MSLVIAVVLLLAVTLLYTLFVRAKDIPPPDPVSPTQHLDERKAAIYENLRDLQFEYRVGKLSDADYQQTKLALQKELAVVLAGIEQIVKSAPSKPAQAARPVPQKAEFVCPHCGKEFPTAMKFCGECGKEMTA